MDARPPGLGLMLGRGLLRRCPRCGSGRLFRRWFRMVDRCPGCTYHFERRAEDGFFLGAYVLNLAVTESALAAVLVGYIVVRSGGDGSGPLWPVFAVAGVVAVVLPLLFYPFSKTLWAAIDLAVRPPEDGA
ncbi:MAG TPA: DUF983 domain-containing protein [Acidimicrobiales bacterium]|nr:DUF983 domain-containing protein [Acidimicrobiales bacterium]